MVGNRPTVEIRGPACDQRPCGLIVGAQSRLGQQLCCRDARLENIRLPQGVGKGDSALNIERIAPSLGKLRDLRIGQAEIAPVGFVIGAHLFGAGRVGLRFEVLKGGFQIHSTVTDFARLRGWSTSVPLATAV